MTLNVNIGFKHTCRYSQENKGMMDESIFVEGKYKLLYLDGYFILAIINIGPDLLKKNEPSALNQVKYYLSVKYNYNKYYVSII